MQQNKLAQCNISDTNQQKLELLNSHKHTHKMVSRRKILNRSRDDLTMDQEEEDVWFSKDKLYKVSCIISYK